MKRKYLIVGLITFSGVSFANFVHAVCPVCVVAVGAGLGLSRWLGVDDVVSSLWIGGVLAAISIWTIIWLSKKGPAQLNAAKPQSRSARLFNRVKEFRYMPVVVFAFYYGLTLIPLYYSGIIGHSLNTIWGIDKIIFGTAAGSVIFLLSSDLHNFLKTKNNGKSYFPYQKVVMPVTILLIISLIFYLWI